MKKLLYIAFLIFSQAAFAQHIEFKDGKWNFSKGEAGAKSDSLVNAFADSVQFSKSKKTLIKWLEKTEKQLDERSVKNMVKDSLQRSGQLDSLAKISREIELAKEEIEELKADIRQAKSFSDISEEKIERLSDRLKESGIKTGGIRKFSKKVSKGRSKAKKIRKRPEDLARPALDTLDEVSKGEKIAKQVVRNKEQVDKTLKKKTLKKRLKAAEKGTVKIGDKEISAKKAKKQLEKKAAKLEEKEEIKKAKETYREVKNQKKLAEKKLKAAKDSLKINQFREMLESYDPADKLWGNGMDTLPQLNRQVVQKELMTQIDSLHASNLQLQKLKEKVKEVSPYVEKVEMTRKNGWQNLFFEGTFGLTGKDFKDFSVSPMLGYNLHKNFTVGLGLTYRHNVNDSIRISSTLGYSVTARFETMNQRLYFQVENEFTLPQFSYVNKEFISDAAARKSNIFFGVGYTLIEFNRNAIVTQINFNPNADRKNFQENLSFKIGFKRK